MPIHVLIADDHAVFRSGLRALLEKEEDISVVAETANGPETIEAASAHEVDVLILDISMPGLSGLHVAGAVLKEKPALAIVVLTMHDDEYYLQELFKIGVQGFVLKKSTGVHLLQAIQAVWRGEQYIDPSMAGRIVTSYIGTEGEKSSSLDILTPDERDICRLLALGRSDAEMAEQLKLSPPTVKTLRINITNKLKLENGEKPIAASEMAQESAIENGELQPRKVGRPHKLSLALVRKALAEANGNKSRAAQVLGVSRATLYRYLPSDD